MNRKYTILLLLILAVILCSCSPSSGNDVTSPAEAETIQTRSEEVTSQSSAEEMLASTVLPSRSLSSTAAPTKAPTPTPLPIPPATFIERVPREDGALFDPMYYAVLKGEGAFYLVYDCFGTIVHTFRFTDAEAKPPVGLINRYDLEIYTHVPTEGEKLPENEGRRYFAGGYIEADRSEGATDPFIYFDNTTTISLAELDDFTYRVYADPKATEISVLARVYPDEENSLDVSVQWYKVSPEGNVIDKFTLQIPWSDIQVVGYNYYIAYGKDDNGLYSLYDTDGNVVMKNVTPLFCGDSIYLQESGIRVTKYDYFLVDDQVYNASLELVEDGTLDADDCLIPGVDYYVGDIACNVLNVISIDSLSYSDLSLMIAVGSDANEAAVWAPWGECVISGVEATVMGANPGYVILNDGNIYSFTTGEFIVKEKYGYKMTDEYLMLYEDNYNYWHTRFFIMDNDGNTRYGSTVNKAQECDGGFFLLSRGPYVGIADLNGDWVIKTVDYEITRDAEPIPGY